MSSPHQKLTTPPWSHLIPRLGAWRGKIGDSRLRLPGICQSGDPRRSQNDKIFTTAATVNTKSMYLSTEHGPWLGETPATVDGMPVFGKGLLQKATSSTKRWMPMTSLPVACRVCFLPLKCRMCRASSCLFRVEAKLGFYSVGSIHSH